MNEIQKNGLKKMNYGINTMISGFFITLEKDYSFYAENDICNLSNVFFEFYNKNKESIDEVSRKEFDGLVKKLHTKSKLECVRESAILE